jgi:hypothetical protein
VLSRERKENQRTTQTAFAVDIHTPYSRLRRGKGTYHAVANTQIVNNGDIWDANCNSVSEGIPPEEIVNGRSIKTYRNRYGRNKYWISEARKKGKGKTKGMTGIRGNGQTPSTH